MAAGGKVLLATCRQHYNNCTGRTSRFRCSVELTVTDCVLVLTTVPLDGRGSAVGRTLVEERLAACVSALPPMTSIYRWQGAVTSDAEQQLVIKTLRQQLPAVERRLRELHPYEVPEFLVIEVAGGGASYLAWLAENVGA